MLIDAYQFVLAAAEAYLGGVLEDVKAVALVDAVEQRLGVVVAGVLSAVLRRGALSASEAAVPQGYILLHPKE